MRRPHLGMLFALACVPILLVPAMTTATPQVGQKDNGFSKCDERYLNLYVEAHKAGLEPGRNLVDDGLLGSRNQPEPITNGRACSEADQLDLALHPPAPEPVASSTYSSGVAPAPVTTSVAPAPASTSGLPPDYIKQCESGGDYSAQNASGAYGAWQIMPSTSAAYGCDMSTPAGQDACAAEIYAAEGASPWVCG